MEIGVRLASGGPLPLIVDRDGGGKLHQFMLKARIDLSFCSVLQCKNDLVRQFDEGVEELSDTKESVFPRVSRYCSRFLLGVLDLYFGIRIRRKSSSAIEKRVTAWGVPLFALLMPVND